MNFKVGIVGSITQGWQNLLEQEGSPYSIITKEQDFNECSAIIITDNQSEKMTEQVKKYLTDGGGVLCSSKFFSLMTGAVHKKSFVKYLIGKSDTYFPNIDLIDVDRELYLPENANVMLTDNYEYSILVERNGYGVIIVLPFDAGELVSGMQFKRKSFYSQHNRLPFELISAVPKGKMLRLISTALKHLHLLRDIPYIHKWYYPQAEQTIFSWRIDTDYSDRENILSLYDTICSENIRASWFIHVKYQESLLSMFKEMSDQEIGLHCYDHETFDDYQNNKENIRKAIECFELQKLDTKSFAAPYGRWNQELGKAISESSFEYSSEFSYDYDNLPSFPLVHGHAGALQIPIHPISIGSLKRQGYNPEMMCNYFEYVFKHKYQNREPLFFYHHPNDNNRDVVKFIFGLMKKNRVANYQMIEYARWWKKRGMIQLQFNIENDSIDVQSSEKSSDHWIHIVKPDGTETFSEIQPSMSLNSLAWTKPPMIEPLPEDIERTRKYNHRITLNLIEDFISQIFKNRK